MNPKRRDCSWSIVMATQFFKVTINCFFSQTSVSYASLPFLWLVVDHELYHCPWSVCTGWCICFMVFCLPQAGCKYIGQIIFMKFASLLITKPNYRCRFISRVFNLLRLLTAEVNLWLKHFRMKHNGSQSRQREICLGQFHAVHEFVFPCYQDVPSLPILKSFWRTIR